MTKTCASSGHPVRPGGVCAGRARWSGGFGQMRASPRNRGVGLPWQIMSAFPACLITKGLRSSTNLGSFSPSCCFCGQMLAPPQSLYLLLWPSLNCGLHSTAAHALFQGFKSSRFTHGTPARESESV